MYGAAEEFPWAEYPEYSIFRHSGNRKWFALFMQVPRVKLGLQGDGLLEILNVKCSPALTSTLLDTFQPGTGLYPAYHMNKKHWLTIALDGSVSETKIKEFIEESYRLTAPKVRAARH